VQGVNTPEKAAGEGSLEKGLKNVGSKFSAVEQLVFQSAETVKERNGIMPTEIPKGVSAVAVVWGLLTHTVFRSRVQETASRGGDGDVCGILACIPAVVKDSYTLHLQDAQREMDDAEQYLAKVEKQYANKRL
jgi:hypothetical protein